MTKIFISYRRQDTRAIAGRIFDRLAAKFGRDNVFMDIDSIPFGVDFHDFLSEQVGRAQTVLALIGPGWIDARDEKGSRRLDDPDDFVRIEIEAALARKIPLGAVLIDGVPMPRPEQLPEAMRALCRRNAAFVDTGRDFHLHMDRLITDLERHIGGALAPQPQASGNGPAAGGTAESEPGRIKIAAPITEGVQNGWFTPGAGKTQWFQDAPFAPQMVAAPAGKFLMGTPDAEIAALTASYGDHFKDEAPQHEVTIPQPFAVGKYAITFDEWEAAQRDGSWPRVTGLPPRQPADQGWGRGKRPVIDVSWQDAQAYVKWLSTKTGQTYRLLSEAEWEYACRAGTETAFWWGDSISAAQANYDGDHVYWGGVKGENRKKTLPVDQFQPNAWGLYQVHGNVLEWIEDCWNYSYMDKPATLKGSSGAWTTGDCAKRVLRGGGWFNLPQYLRAAYRYFDSPGYRYYDIGFRVARTLSVTS